MAAHKLVQMKLSNLEKSEYGLFFQEYIFSLRSHCTLLESGSYAVDGAYISLFTWYSIGIDKDCRVPRP